jgi:hypothetical protein
MEKLQAILVRLGDKQNTQQAINFKPGPWDVETTIVGTLAIGSQVFVMQKAQV